MRTMMQLVRPHHDVRFGEYGKRTLIALSHALEDVGTTGGVRPLVFGSFQRGRFFAHDRDRYAVIAAHSALTVVVGGGMDTDAQATPARIDVPADDPLCNDWVLVIYGGGDTAAVLIARDRLEDEVDDLPTDLRRSVAVWGHDPVLARDAARWVGGYLERHDPPLSARWRRELAAMPAPSTGAPDRPRTWIPDALRAELDRGDGADADALQALREAITAER